MKKSLLLFSLLLSGSWLMAQTPTYADDVAAIIFEKCTGCHRLGGAGDIAGSPGSLMTYTQAYNNRT